MEGRGGFVAAVQCYWDWIGGVANGIFWEVPFTIQCLEASVAFWGKDLEGQGEAGVGVKEGVVFVHSFGNHCLGCWVLQSVVVELGGGGGGF